MFTIDHFFSLTFSATRTWSPEDIEANAYRVTICVYACAGLHLGFFQGGSNTLAVLAYRGRQTLYAKATL